MAKKAGKAKAKQAPARRVITAQALAEVVGVALKPPLRTDQVNRLRKALPGYVSVLDDAADQLADDPTLRLPDVKPADLLAAKEEQRALSAREAVLETVYRSVYYQRLQVDDRAIGMLQKIARRVEALAEDDPDLRARWKFLRDFLATFRPGQGKKAAPPGETPPAAASG